MLLHRLKYPTPSAVLLPSFVTATGPRFALQITHIAPCFSGITLARSREQCETPDTGDLLRATHRLVTS
jgi:hypothetical protein